MKLLPFKIHAARLLSFGFCLATLPALLESQSPLLAPLTLMPMPSSVMQGPGEFVVDRQLTVQLTGYTEPRLMRARERFLKALTRETGIPFEHGDAAGMARIDVHTSGPSAVVQELGEDESYRLHVSPTGVQLTAANPLGTMHGLETLLQLVKITPRGFTFPAIDVDDKPRFPWRGLMIDSGRHFIPLSAIERNLDAMAAVKLNVFHWHLSEDQGFRVESKLYPLLQEKGSDGLFYTQDEIRRTVEYARDRGIRVVPEFDMPGHSTAWFVGYPQLASGPGPFEIERKWGIFDPAMDPTRESTYEFLDRFIGEMVNLFPDLYFHIGGDECNGKQWDGNPRIQEYMKAHGIKDNAALQALFTARVQKLVAGHHKVMEGWDEVLQPDTPKDVVIQSWRGRESLLDAARRGYKSLLSNGYYIDLMESAESHYVVDPLDGIADKLTPEQAASILGGEATMWSEFVVDENIDGRIWPRTAAIAERLWSPQSVRDVDSMYRRLPLIMLRLEASGVNVQATSEAMLERMSGDLDPVALRVLASVVEPPKQYSREELRNYTSFTPLNRLVDAVPAESDTAREFRLLCGRIASGKASDADRDRARELLTLWRDNDARLQPLLVRSEFTAELVPVSKSLHDVAEIGLRALDAIHSGQRLSGQAKQQDLEALKAAAKPQAVLLLMVVKPVEALVNSVKVQ